MQVQKKQFRILSGKLFITRRGLFILMAFTAVQYQSLFTQNFNPPYPRLGIFTFSGVEDACVDILKDFDIIAIPADAEMARKYKSANPDVVMLSNCGTLYDFENNCPEEWYYHDSNGQRIRLFGNYYLKNLTTLCPYVDLGTGYGPEQYIDYAARHVQNVVDFNQFDGLFYDWWGWGPGSDGKFKGDLDRNGVVDLQEWGIDSIRIVWQNGIRKYHEIAAQIPGNDYTVVQIGTDDAAAYSLFNGFCFEDWPIYNGPWARWRKYYNDDKTTTLEPKIMIFDASISHYNNNYPVTPYKNNYRSVRFGFSSCLLTSAYFYVDEGNQIGHHGNIHIYDEFEMKGELGYPRSNMFQMPGITLAATDNASGVWIRFFDNGVSIVNVTGLPQTITASEIAALDPVGGSRYYKFRGGQDPDFNNGTEVSNGNPLALWGDTHMANWGTPEAFGDGAVLFRSRKVFITPIIVDNHENNQTSPGSDPVAYTGGWVLGSNGEKYYAGYTGRNYGPFQPDAFAWSSAGSGENKARYTPTIGLTGDYEVFEWHGYVGGSPSGLSSNVPALINSDGGKETTVHIDQTQKFGQWNSLGTFLFREGTDGYVELSNNTAGIVISDAIKFVYKSTTTMDFDAPKPPQGVEVH